MEHSENTENKTEILGDKIATGTEPSWTVVATANKRLLALIALVAIVAGALGGAFGSQSLMRFPELRNLSTNQQLTLQEDSAIVDVVKKASPAVVSIVISQDLNKLPGYSLNSPFGFDPFFSDPFQQPQSDEPNIQQVGAGSGFFVTSDGLILTNKHVVSNEEASYSVVTNDGKSYPAKVVAIDPINDLAIVKIEISNAPILELADSNQNQIGQRVVAIGNSLGQYQNTVTSGIISGIGRSITAGDGQTNEQLEGVIQTDAAINPGNSGGPLLNAAGQVIGINTAVDRGGESVGFAIPSNDAVKALQSFQTAGRIMRPQLGVRYIMVTEALAKERGLARDYGALVVSGNQPGNPAIVPGSAAERAGIKEKDIILKVEGTRIGENYTLSKSLRERSVGDEVRMLIYRDGQEIEVKVTLGESQ
ncbi:MAG: trypsin-like peptidase domain-containing protein [Candidatus Doudnabacteria bacterium]|nr:trypsin-like peptidase domain-containing protein [Candidatus Doudnabacteria bacterium]